MVVSKSIETMGNFETCVAIMKRSNEERGL